jgi:hypothetical protein
MKFISVKLVQWRPWIFEYSLYLRSTASITTHVAAYVVTVDGKIKLPISAPPLFSPNSSNTFINAVRGEFSDCTWHGYLLSSSHSCRISLSFHPEIRNSSTESITLLRPERLGRFVLALLPDPLSFTLWSMPRGRRI